MATTEGTPEPAPDNTGLENGDVSRRRWTIPNTLSAIRLIGSIGLICLALAGQPALFVVVFLVLAMTDWVDGKLAIWLHQRTVLGARLDSAADATLFAALLFGSVWLNAGLLYAERYWLAAAVVSYLVTTATGLIKYGRVPSYHTRAAKTCWLLIIIAVVYLFMEWSLWPLRLAMLGVTLTNLEATLMTLVLARWHADVPSLYHAWKIRRSEAEA